MRESHFFQNCGTFCFFFYWKYHNFKRYAFRACVFLQCTAFRNHFKYFVLWLDWWKFLPLSLELNVLQTRMLFQNFMSVRTRQYIYSHLSNKGGNLLIVFGIFFHPPRKNPPSSFIDFLDSTLFFYSSESPEGWS